MILLDLYRALWPSIRSPAKPPRRHPEPDLLHFCIGK